MEKLGELRDVLPIHVADESERKLNRPLKNMSHHEERIKSKSKSRFPKVPKSPRRRIPRSMNQSEDESDSKVDSNDKKYAMHEDNGQAVKCFMNVIRRAIRSKRKEAVSENKHMGSGSSHI